MASSHLLNDPEHWRERARAMCSLAAEMTDAVSRDVMLRIAAEYEVLAQRAEDRIAQKALRNGDETRMSLEAREGRMISRDGG